MAQRGNEVGALTGLLAAAGALAYRVAAFRAGGVNGGLDELMAQSISGFGARAQFLAAAAALCYLVAILGAGGLDCYRLAIMVPISGVWSDLFHPDNLTAGAAPVGLRAFSVQVGETFSAA